MTNAPHQTKPEFFSSLLEQVVNALGTSSQGEIPLQAQVQIAAATEAFSAVAPHIAKIALLAGCEKLDAFIRGEETDRRKLAALSMRLRILTHLDRSFKKATSPQVAHDSAWRATDIPAAPGSVSSPNSAPSTQNSALSPQGAKQPEKSAPALHHTAPAKSLDEVLSENHTFLSTKPLLPSLSVPTPQSPQSLVGGLARSRISALPPNGPGASRCSDLLASAGQLISHTFATTS